MRFIKQTLHLSAVHQIRRIRGMLMLAALFAHCTAHAAEDWLTRSQNIFNALEGQPLPGWLDSNPYQAEAKRQALDILNASKPVALRGAINDQKPVNNLKSKPLPACSHVSVSTSSICPWR